MVPGVGRLSGLGEVARQGGGRSACVGRARGSVSCWPGKGGSGFRGGGRGGRSEPGNQGGGPG